MSNLSFEAIRNVAQQSKPAQVVAQAVEKTVETAKSIGSKIHGVLPASNNRVDGLEENAAIAISALKIEIDNLRAQIGLERVPVDSADVVMGAQALIEMWSGKVAKPAPVAVTEVPLPRIPEQPVQTPVAEVTPVVEAPEVPGNPLFNGVFSTPTNWNQA